MAAAAPLSKPVSKKPIKHSATPAMPMSLTVRGKRARASIDYPDTDRPATAIRKKDGMKAVGTIGASPSSNLNGNGVGAAIGDPANAYRKGMFLAFIDDAFARRAKGDNERYNQLISQFKYLIPSSNPHERSEAVSAASGSSISSANNNAPTTSQMRVWLDALTHVVSKLDETHTPLVQTILAVPWATMEEPFVNSYIRFIGALVSARQQWLSSILEGCVKGFRYKSTYTTQGTPAAMPSLTRRILYGRLHALVRMLISLIPTLAPALSPLLSTHFPSKREAKFSQICYINNLLVLTEYCNALVEDVLTLIIGRALNIDVEIQGEPEEWEEAEEELMVNTNQQSPAERISGIQDLVDRPTELDDDLRGDSSDDEDDEEGDDGDEGGLDFDNIDSDDEPDPVNDEDAAKHARKKKSGMSLEAVKKVLENRSKLDAILKVVLDHLAVVHDRKVSANSQEQVEASGSKETTPTPENATPSLDSVERRRVLFRTLLNIFDRTLLRTFKTRNTQFVLFYLCSLDSSSTDHFIGVLLGRALYQDEAPAVTRVAAAGYAASFVSRAKFVDGGMTRKVVKHLCDFLEERMDDFGSGSAGPAGSQHDLPVFYAVAQAIFYIFCFRWRDLLDEPGEEEDEIVLEQPGRRWMMGLETVKKVVGSSYNPLKVCAQPVVNQFAAVAHKSNFMYCYAFLESNRRNTSRDSLGMPLPSPLPASPTKSSVPPSPLRNNSSTYTIRSMKIVSSQGGTATLPNPAVGPRQLLVAEEMDSFFPFDPFKLPLCSAYIDDIYREWVADDDEEDGSNASSETSSDLDSDDSDEDDSTDADNATETEATTSTESKWIGGLAVPGLGPNNTLSSDEDDVARSFEAMSLSPDREAFGGRGKAIQMTSF